MKHRDQVRVFQAGPVGERFRDRDATPARRTGIQGPVGQRQRSEYQTLIAAMPIQAAITHQSPAL